MIVTATARGGIGSEEDSRYILEPAAGVAPARVANPPHYHEGADEVGADDGSRTRPNDRGWKPRALPTELRPQVKLERLSGLAPDSLPWQGSVITHIL